MIDIENKVFTAVAEALEAKFPNISISSDSLKVPSKFPHVAVEQRGNITFRRTLDSDFTENHAISMFEVNVYSNKSSGRKSEAKAIMNTVDEVFISLNYRRSYMDSLPNVNDPTIFRLYGRYQAIVGKDDTIYRG